MSICKQRGTRMKSNSIVNLLTAVMFSLVTVFSHVVLANTENDGTKEKSDLEIMIEKNCGSLKDAEKNECERCTSTSSKTGVCAKYFLGATDSKCEDALKEYHKKVNEFAKACTAVKNPSARLSSQKNSVDSLFGSGTGQKSPTINIDDSLNCKKRVFQCREQINSISSGSQIDDPNSVDNILKTVMAVKDPEGLQEYEKVAGANQQNDQSMSIQDCAESFSNKDVDQKVKDYKQEKQRLKEKLSKLSEDYNKEMEKQNEKNAEITKKIEELQSKSKEKNRESDAKLREKNTENQKNSINYAKQARDINNKIIAKQVQLKKMQFDNANKMLSETTDKINMQCQAVLNKAQECLVKSIKTKGAISEDCKSFPVLTKKRGAGATTELKNKMKFINEQCYQEADTSKKNAAYAYQEAVSQANREIQNMQQDLQDLQNNINIEANNSSSIQQEAKREQDENAQSVALQTANFNNELNNALLRSRQRQQTLNEETKQLEDEIKQLDFEQKTGTSSKIKAIEDVITDYEQTRDITNDSCGCNLNFENTEITNKDNVNPNVASTACSQLKKFDTKAGASLKPRKAK